MYDIDLEFLLNNKPDLLQLFLYFQAKGQVPVLFVSSPKYTSVWDQWVCLGTGLVTGDTGCITSLSPSLQVSRNPDPRGDDAAYLAVTLGLP